MRMNMEKGVRRTKTWASAAAASVGAMLGALGVFASNASAQIPDPVVGQPVNGAIDLQGPANEVSLEIHHFHSLVLVIITVITAVVLALLLWVMVRYNRKANPVPRKFTHNMTVEVLWTVVPVLILVAIAVQSFPLLAKEELAPKTEMTIKAIGNSWFWSYEYPDYNVSFDANVLTKDDATAAGKPYLLSTDEAVVLPENTRVKVLISSNDVINSWTIQSFGVKQDAIPGRVNQGWFDTGAPRVLYGQCSELCGIRHAYMPIEVHIVPKAEFEAWVASKGGTLATAAAPAEAAPAAPAVPAAPAAPGGAAPAPVNPAR
jgi:cytochrome c oxidase subunit 2